MAAAEHDHDHHEHHHIDYQSVSLVSAVSCPRCGVYLSFQFTGEHNAFHDQLDELAAPQPIKKSTPRRSTSKKASSDA